MANETGGLTRYINVAVAPSVDQLLDAAAVDVWIGCELDDRYMRRQLRHGQLSLDGVRGTLPSWMAEAVDAAALVTPDLLDQVKAVPRPGSVDGHRRQGPIGVDRVAAYGAGDRRGIAQILESYEAALYEGGLTQNTISNYVAQVRRFLRWLDGD